MRHLHSFSIQKPPTPPHYSEPVSHKIPLLRRESKMSSPAKSTAPVATRVQQQQQESDNIAHALAGAGGGLLSMTLTYPLITLSTRAQVESKRAESSTYDAARRIIAREGVAGLYSGLESALFGISVTNFVYYYWYEWTRSLFTRAALRTNRASKSLTTVESMLCGALAGSATVLITNPIWVINTRMTASSSSSSSSSSSKLPTTTTQTTSTKGKPSTISTLLLLLRNEGPLALFSGVLPALVLVINPILQYTIFEKLKEVLEKRRQRKIGGWNAFLLGAVSKLCATGITYPYITIKSRMHVAADKESQQENMLKSLRKVVREEGWGGLYKGIGPKISQSVITAAFLFAFKDYLYAASVQARHRFPKTI